ncbi:hypothetical protein LTR10_005802 [Elasticomyces elasticus]|nr:hypothetical protein LTR10_005802 [Elasticomyces elasticus]KAK4965009.1 hypothetical protein LTR42_012427 [Elasticomyces elasticus]
MADCCQVEELNTRSRYSNWRSSPWLITLSVAYAVYTEQFLFAVIVPVAPFSLQKQGNIEPVRIQYWVAWLLATYGIASVVSSPFYGWWTDRHASRRLTFLLGLFWLLGATILLWFANSKALLLISRMLQGIGATVIWTTGLALLVDAVGEAHIGEYMGYIGIALNLSTLTGPILGGVVYAKAGINAVFGMMCGILSIDILLRLLMIERKAPTRHSFISRCRSAIKLSGDDTTCYLCVMNGGMKKTSALSAPPFSLCEGRGPGRRPLERTSSCTLDEIHAKRPPRWQLPPVVTLLFSWRCLSALWGGFVYATVLSGLQTVLPLRLFDIFGWDSIGGGLIFLPLVAPGLLGPLVGAIVDRFGHRWIAAAAFAVLSPALILLRFIQHNTLAQKATLCVLLGIAGLCGTCLLEPLIAEITYLGGGQGVGGTKVRSYAQAYALFNIAWELGDTAGPLLAGLMLKSVGWETMTMTLGILAGVSAITTALWYGGWVFNR